MHKVGDMIFFFLVCVHAKLLTDGSGALLFRQQNKRAAGLTADPQIHFLTLTNLSACLFQHQQKDRWKIIRPCSGDDYTLPVIWQ